MISVFTGSPQNFSYMSDFDFGDYPIGAFAEIFSVPKFLSGLRSIPKDQPWHLAHVTSWMRKSEKITSLMLPENYKRHPGWRWTIDYPEDYRFIVELIKQLGSDWNTLQYPEISEILMANPELNLINANLRQKNLELG